MKKQKHTILKIDETRDRYRDGTEHWHYTVWTKSGRAYIYNFNRRVSAEEVLNYHKACQKEIYKTYLSGNQTPQNNWQMRALLGIEDDVYYDDFKRC